jgi:hypothetical protein
MQPSPTADHSCRQKVNKIRLFQGQATQLLRYLRLGAIPFPQAAQPHAPLPLLRVGFIHVAGFIVGVRLE